MTSNLISKPYTTASNPQPKRRSRIPSIRHFNPSCSSLPAPKDFATWTPSTPPPALPRNTKNPPHFPTLLPPTAPSANRNYRSRLVLRTTKRCLNLFIILAHQTLTPELPSYNLTPRSLPFLVQRPTRTLPPTSPPLAASSIRNQTLTFAFQASTPTASDFLLSPLLYNFLLIWIPTSNAFPKSISTRNNVRCAGNCFTECALPTPKPNPHGARVRFQPSTPSNLAALG